MALGESSVVRSIRLITPQGFTAGMTLDVPTKIAIHVASTPCTLASCDTSPATQCAVITALQGEDTDNIERTCVSALTGSYVYFVLHALPAPSLASASIAAFTFEVYAFFELGVTWSSELNSFINLNKLPAYPGALSFWGVRKFKLGSTYKCEHSASEKISDVVTTNLPACFTLCESTSECRSVDWYPATKHCVLLKDFEDDTKCTASVNGATGFKLFLNVSDTLRSAARKQRRCRFLLPHTTTHTLTHPRTHARTEHMKDSCSFRRNGTTYINELGCGQESSFLRAAQGAPPRKKITNFGLDDVMQLIDMACPHIHRFEFRNMELTTIPTR
jgi:hypothetical protein